jgi:hypothetical protein
MTIRRGQHGTVQSVRKSRQNGLGRYMKPSVMISKGRQRFAVGLDVRGVVSFRRLRHKSIVVVDAFMVLGVHQKPGDAGILT